MNIMIVYFVFLLKKILWFKIFGRKKHWDIYCFPVISGLRIATVRTYWALLWRICCVSLGTYGFLEKKNDVGKLDEKTISVSDMGRKNILKALHAAICVWLKTIVKWMVPRFWNRFYIKCAYKYVHVQINLTEKVYYNPCLSLEKNASFDINESTINHFLK